MNRILAIVLLLSAFFLSSCSTFKLVDSNFDVKGKKIAVISGLNKPENMVYASILTEAMKKHTTFKVVSQNEIKERVADYPTRIKGPYLAYMGLDSEYSRTNLKQIEEIQKKLGVDFVYIIWVPTSYTRSDSILRTCTVGQIFAFPGCREIGRSEYEINWSVPGSLAFVYSENVEEAMTEKGDKSVAEIAEKMNVKRAESVMKKKGSK